MDNELKITNIDIKKNKIEIEYLIKGNWSNVFESKNNFFVEYSHDISNIDKSIAVIPFLCNILPISWLFDAEIIVDSIDKDFMECIENVKKGYKDMYPMLSFKGKFTYSNVKENKKSNKGGNLAFFSGGVDAFNTLVSHMQERPTLFVVWGADIDIDESTGWNNMNKSTEKTVNEFNLDYIIAKSSLRKFINSNVLCEKVKISGDDWWHGFQHGLGMIGLVAPIAFKYDKENIYFASSFTAEDKGKYTCASDPTIDNFIKFCKCNVIHDGYEFCRQDKVHNIIQFCQKTNKKIELRVCWESTGGKNCCQCEKCYRTMLAIFAEGENPRKYGFDYNRKQLKKIKYCQNDKFNYKRYIKIQSRMREKCNLNDIPKEIQWFYKIDISKLGYHPIYTFLRKVKNKIKRILK